MKNFAPKCSAKITVYQSMQNLCKWFIYSLLNRRKWFHVSRPVRRRTDQYARDTLSILQTFLILLNRQTGQLAHLI